MSKLRACGRSSRPEWAAQQLLQAASSGLVRKPVKCNSKNYKDPIQYFRYLDNNPRSTGGPRGLRFGIARINRSAEPSKGIERSRVNAGGSQNITISSKIMLRQAQPPHWHEEC